MPLDDDVKNMTCSVLGCDRPRLSKELCNAHYKRQRYKGSTDSGRKVGEGRGLAWLRESFLQQTDDCILWPFSLGSKGYGQIGIGRSNRLAHRVSCELAHGPAPSPDHQAAHSCGDRRCVNPRHLRWATVKENAADRIVHGTHLEGETAGRAKLTNRQAGAIRSDNRPSRVIAAEYGVSRGCINFIKRGVTYRAAALGMT